MTTIRDVAARAGVSPATVSRVFNGQSVSEARRTAVENAVRELRFVPNRTARSLRTRRSTSIGLIVPDIENPFFAEIARGVEDVASQAGLSLLLYNTDSDRGGRGSSVGHAMLGQVAGVIFGAGASSADLNSLVRSGKPVVAVDRSTGYDLDETVVANRKVGRDATTILIESGYVRIACISGPVSVETAFERAAGWRDAMAARRSDEDLSDLLIHTSFDVQGGRSAAERLLRVSNPPRALFAANNLLAVGALQVLAENGLHPPQYGVSVAGTLPYSTMSPSLINIIDLPARAMGVNAAKMLLERVAGDTQPTRTVILGHVVRPANS